jgi:hypothetical protein
LVHLAIEVIAVALDPIGRAAVVPLVPLSMGQRIADQGRHGGHDRSSTATEERREHGPHDQEDNEEIQQGKEEHHGNEKPVVESGQGAAQSILNWA